jgi:hypothetical protein
MLKGPYAYLLTMAEPSAEFKQLSSFFEKAVLPLPSNLTADLYPGCPALIQKQPGLLTQWRNERSGGRRSLLPAEPFKKLLVPVKS